VYNSGDITKFPRGRLGGIAPQFLAMAAIAPIAMESAPISRQQRRRQQQQQQVVPFGWT